MSILIKGMEMPTDGTFNIVHIYSDGRVSIPCWGKGMQVVQGIEAIPVPPHGRLGDLDKLYKKMEHYSDNEGATGYQDDALIVRDSVLFAIEDAPTIIPASEEGE